MKEKKTLIEVLFVSGPLRENQRKLVVVNALESFQALVGGYIECVEGNVYCNEEGRLTGLPATLWWKEGKQTIRGCAVVTGQPDEEGETTSVTDEDIKRFREHFRPKGRD